MTQLYAQMAVSVSAAAKYLWNIKQQALIGRIVNASFRFINE